MAVAATSALVPFAAAWHWLAGRRRARRIVSEDETPGGPKAVLFDRDGTLIVDRPCSGDPDRVELMPGAREAIDRLRAAGVPTAVVSDQSGVGRGLLALADVDAVNARVEQLLGPLGPWAICPHEPGEGCPCRKPAGGMIVDAAGQLGVAAHECVVIGDRRADAAAAHAAGAKAVLVPADVTLAKAPGLADVVAPDLPSAVEIVLAWKARGGDRQGQ
jgi:histidinol-phosphate phosphatase family protein